MKNTLYERLQALPIEDLAPVFDNGARGRTMSASSCNWLLSKVCEAGVKTIIDLRTADHSDKFCKLSFAIFSCCFLLIFISKSPDATPRLPFIMQ